MPGDLEALRAELLADPATAEIAEGEGMTLEAYVEATIAFCADPDAGFAGGGVAVNELPDDRDDYSGERPAALPQPDRARSHPDLPKVKSTAFKVHHR